MMKIIRLSGSLFLLIFLLAACAGPKSLERKINRTAYEPVLFYETDKVLEKSATKVSLELINNSNLPARSTVFKNEGRMLWLLLYQKYEYDMTITLGDNASEPTAVNLVENAITGTFERSGDFETSGKAASDYKGVVTIKQMDVTCDFYTKGFAFWGVSDYSANADNSIGDLAFNLKLYDKEGSLVLDKDYSEQQAMKYNSSSVKLHEVKKMAMKNMIENLTVSSQNIAAAMTADINKILQNPVGLSLNRTELQN